MSTKNIYQLKTPSFAEEAINKLILLTYGIIGLPLGFSLKDNLISMLKSVEQTKLIFGFRNYLEHLFYEILRTMFGNQDIWKSVLGHSSETELELPFHFFIEKSFTNTEYIEFDNLKFATLAKLMIKPMHELNISDVHFFKYTIHGSNVICLIHLKLPKSDKDGISIKLLQNHDDLKHYNYKASQTLKMISIDKELLCSPSKELGLAYLDDAVEFTRKYEWLKKKVLDNQMDCSSKSAIRVSYIGEQEIDFLTTFRNKAMSDETSQGLYDYLLPQIENRTFNNSKFKKLKDLNETHLTEISFRKILTDGLIVSDKYKNNLRTSDENKMTTMFQLSETPKTKEQIFLKSFYHSFCFTYHQVLWKTNNYQLTSKIMNSSCVNLYTELSDRSKTKWRDPISHIRARIFDDVEKIMRIHREKYIPAEFIEDDIFQNFNTQWEYHEEYSPSLSAIKSCFREKWKSSELRIAGEKLNTIEELHQKIGNGLFSYGGKDNYLIPYIVRYLKQHSGLTNKKIANLFKYPGIQLDQEIEQLCLTAQNGLNKYRDQILFEYKHERLRNLLGLDAPSPIDYQLTDGLSFQNLLTLVYENSDSVQNEKNRVFHLLRIASLEDLNDLIEAIEGVLKVKVSKKFSSSKEHIQYIDGISIKSEQKVLKTIRACEKKSKIERSRGGFNH